MTDRREESQCFVEGRKSVRLCVDSAGQTADDRSTHETRRVGKGRRLVLGPDFLRCGVEVILFVGLDGEQAEGERESMS